MVCLAHGGRLDGQRSRLVRDPDAFACPATHAPFAKMSAGPLCCKLCTRGRMRCATAGNDSSGWLREQTDDNRHLRFSAAAHTPLLSPAPDQPPQRSLRPHPQCRLPRTAVRLPAACSPLPSAARCRAARLHAYGGVCVIQHNQVTCPMHHGRYPYNALQLSPRSTFSAAAAGSSAAAWRRAAAPCAARSCSAGAAADVALGRPLGVQGRWGVEIELPGARQKASKAAGSCSLCTGLGALLHVC